MKIPFILRYIPALYLLIMGALLCGIEGCHVLLDLPKGFVNLNPDSSDFLPKKVFYFVAIKSDYIKATSSDVSLISVSLSNF